MIKAEEFVEAARASGFTKYMGVPCSFLTPLINNVINDEDLDYISSANEGDALATAAGAAIGGQRAIVMMQNSGLGNAVSPLTSLAFVFRIPVLMICTHRGASDIKDEPQHELMGRITDRLFETMEIPWEVFPRKSSNLGPALQRVKDHFREERRPFAFLMSKGTVAPVELRNNEIGLRQSPATVQRNDDAGKRLTRSEALQCIIEMTDSSDTVVIATTGFTGRELFALADRPNHLYMVGSMGCASSMGLGLARARPDLRVVVVDGDGAALMRMGNFSTLGAYGDNNLIHFVLDNEVHESTGAQATVSSGVEFASIAKACGYGQCFEGSDIAIIEQLLSNNPGVQGPQFGHVKIRPGTLDNLPRPTLTPVQVVDRLMRHIDTQF